MKHRDKYLKIKLKQSLNMWIKPNAFKKKTKNVLMRRAIQHFYGKIMTIEMV